MCRSNGRHRTGKQITVNHFKPLPALFAALSLSLAACGGATEVVAGQASNAASGPCDPGPSANIEADPSVDPELRGEELLKFLTGVDEIAMQEESEGEEIVIDNANFGGVYGDRAGGWVVAVLDCDVVNVDRVAAIAGGADNVRMIKVAHTFNEVDQFSDDLNAEIADREIPADVIIDSTLDGRQIIVTVEDLDDIPDDFGAGIPFTVEQGNVFSEDIAPDELEAAQDGPVTFDGFEVRDNILDLELNACHPDITNLQVTEDEGTVVITLSELVTPPTTNAAGEEDVVTECQSVFQVVLEQPLNNRRVIDGSTGDPVLGS